MPPPADLSPLLPSEKDALIAALLARVKALLEEVEGLRTENAALRDKLSLPPKTPRNSSKPPSQEMKANGETEPKPKSKPHAGAYRPLHPTPEAQHLGLLGFAGSERLSRARRELLV